MFSSLSRKDRRVVEGIALASMAPKSTDRDSVQTLIHYMGELQKDIDQLKAINESQFEVIEDLKANANPCTTLEEATESE